MKISWRVKAHHLVTTIGFSQSRVFAAAKHSKLLCLNATNGELHWQSNILNPWGRLALNSTTVFYLNQHDFLVAFNIDDGKQIWSKKLNGTFGWLHASENKIIVGGWRGYTDLYCFDAHTGEICWQLPTRNRNLNRTFISKNQISIGIASNDQAEITLFELETGATLKSLKLPGVWILSNVDYMPVSSSGSWASIGKYLIFKITGSSFCRIDSDSLDIELFEVDREISSLNLEEYMNLIPFVSNQSSLIVFNLDTKDCKNFGVIEHNKNYFLPAFTQNSIGIFIGTSSGLLYCFQNNHHSKIRVGKQVSTRLGWSGGHLCFGTASGEIIGVQVEKE
jgi:outer membrane protein assembly factor BamB